MSTNLEQQAEAVFSPRWSDDTTTANLLASGAPQPEAMVFTLDEGQAHVYRVIIRGRDQRDTGVSYWRNLSEDLSLHAAGSGCVIEYEAPDEYLGDPEDIVVSTSSWPYLWSTQEAGLMPWTEEKNSRRCQLIDKEIEGTLSPIETRELAQLQAAMLKYRHSVAPLPLKDLRELHQELLQRAADQSKSGK